MKLSYTLCALILCLLAVSVTGCSSSDSDDDPNLVSVSGIVYDVNDDPIEGAQVTITSDPVTVTTDSQGYFKAMVEPGNHTISINKAYSNIHIAAFTCSEDTPMDLGDISTTYDPIVSATDDDGDGYSEDQGDCDDTDPDINPASTEDCDDGIDNDCDGDIDCQDSDCDGDGNTVDDGDDTAYEPSPTVFEIPDGERIIFVKRFMVLNTVVWELYSMNPSGNDVRRHSEITQDGYTISMPEIARDGKTITFSSNFKTWLSAFYKDIFLWDLTSDYVSRISGDQRPFLPNNTTDLTVNVVYPPDMITSSSQIRVSFKGCTDFVHPSPYTSSSKALNVDQVVVKVPADEDIWIKAEVSSGKGDVKFVRIPKGSTEVIQLDLRNGTQQADFPSVSTNGNLVACAITSNDATFECSKIAVYSRDGSILYEDNVGGATLCGDSTPVFSPDGSNIAYCPGQPASTGLGILATQDPTASPSMLFTSSFLNGYPISSFPTWSPDGSDIVFNITYISGLAMSTNLYKIPAVGGNLQQLTFYTGNSIAGKASYSPDGTKITFTLLTSDNPDFFSIAEDYSSNIYVMSSSGGVATQITHDGISKDPSWGTVVK